jgi:hypothetical protein
MSPVEVIVLKRERYLASRRFGSVCWLYSCDGPDGTHFTNTSIVTLRSLLRQRYGRIVIVEPWR